MDNVADNDYDITNSRHSVPLQREAAPDHDRITIMLRYLDLLDIQRKAGNHAQHKQTTVGRIVHCSCGLHVTRVKDSEIIRARLYARDVLGVILKA